MKKAVVLLLIIYSLLLCAFTPVGKLTEEEKQVINNFVNNHEVDVRLFPREIHEDDGELPTLVVPFTIFIDGLIIEGGYAFIDLPQDVLDYIFEAGNDTGL